MAQTAKPPAPSPRGLADVVAAVFRMAGWAADVMEQHLDNRLIRPDSEYVGKRDQQVVALRDR